ncbi:unnamed protein product [Heligmosomoides polygyrus]|uniref:ATP-dependent DNA helicase n=1 Tax=Heligmosomoides polygyrus TaxID=6339 RepID=A0A183F508_HELPZ|nr:unnamed protein product [Heligmosomoides polygyrus]
MAPKQALEAVNSLLQDIMQKNEPFGGKIMLLGEDFGQVLPVAEKGSRRDFVENGFPILVTEKFLQMRTGTIKVPDDLICEGDVAEAIFEEALNGGNGDFWELAILTPRNVDALRMNDYVPDRL